MTCIRVRACTHQLASWPRPRWKRSAREAIQPAVSAVQPSIDFLNSIADGFRYRPAGSPIVGIGHDAPYLLRICMPIFPAS